MFVNFLSNYWSTMEYEMVESLKWDIDFVNAKILKIDATHIRTKKKRTYMNVPVGTYSAFTFPSSGSIIFLSIIGPRSTKSSERTLEEASSLVLI